jgi:uncharacterized damage-inducible protein DinB
MSVMGGRKEDRMDERLERIGHLAAVAVGLEREGCYNGAKLVRAMLERELLRHADGHAAAGSEALGDAVAAIRHGLGDDEPEALRAGLAATAAAVRAGATLPLDAAPRTRTCRACGELLLGEDAPATCPTCESPALCYREHLPVWFLEPAEPGAALAALAEGPQRIMEALAGRDDAALGRSPAPGAWSVREALEHVLFAEQLFSERLERLLTEDGPDLAARAVWAETPPSDEGSVRTGEPARVLAQRYQALRAATVGRLRALDEGGWARAGRHAEWGRVTVLSQAAYFARHEASHLAQVVAAAGGRVPGRA